MKVEDVNMDWIPKNGQIYFVPSYADEKMFNYLTWRNDRIDNRIKRNVGIYRTKEEAIAKAKELGWT
jgi:hypothetical protein